MIESSEAGRDILWARENRDASIGRSSCVGHSSRGSCAPVSFKWRRSSSATLRTVGSRIFGKLCLSLVSYWSIARSCSWPKNKLLGPGKLFISVGDVGWNSSRTSSTFSNTLSCMCGSCCETCLVAICGGLPNEQTWDDYGVKVVVWVVTKSSKSCFFLYLESFKTHNFYLQPLH